MKDFIDVMALQQSQRDSLKSNKNIQLDYKNREGKGIGSRFLFECAIKLNMKPLTTAMAAIIYHRFLREVDITDYDCYVSILNLILIKRGESYSIGANDLVRYYLTLP